MDFKTDERKWNSANTQMLLSLYNERQAEFRDPKRKIKEVWGDMVEALQSEGMLDIDAVQLDRKFRNLKKTYYCIRNKHLAKGPQFHPNWQFYDQMSAILKDDPIPSQPLSMDNFSAMRTFLCDGDDDTADNMVISDTQDGRVVSLGTVQKVIPGQVRQYRKRKSADAGRLGMQKIRNLQAAEPPRELDHITVFNAAEPEMNDSGAKDDELSIGSMEEALRHLRALQEYAMIQDNFRAIGLLMQAENAIKYPPKSNDFEEDQT
ncbi:uncharacterized protein LOC128259129 [Drosophila gunungcola]|uniref:Myb/SANT-like DNA-binding domain-containing protein n=1 Tax=Drosophila gunungcola TaxID=103775 RepID=A0A9P9YM79_9MUSC|nr:uncharacterized protein LOC128259129 [Drosophila gunungcola]KAI8039313.1 hypothetical protein M5D96_008036 [Drosophila gunungcola]